MVTRADSFSQVPETADSRRSLYTVLITTDNREAALSVSDYLERIGYTVKIAVYDGKALNAPTNIEPNAILCYFSQYLEALPTICRALKTHYARQMPPLIGAISDSTAIDSNLFDSVIFPPAHHSQIANRVNSMVRLQEMEVEIALRVATLSESFGINAELKGADSGERYRILFIGKASPEFMIIVNALQKRNVEVVAAFTSFSAFDYLHEHTFDAVVMNALENSEPALTIGETMRRNSKLYHVPTLFLVNENTFDDHALAFERGARDIIASSSPEPEISGRILELANYHRVHNKLKAEFSGLSDAACMDVPSHVFNAQFFETHMKRVCDFNQNRGSSVSIMSFKLSCQSELNLDSDKIQRAYAQVGNILKNLVRMHDVVARLEDDLYVVAFSGLPQYMTDSIENRILGIVKCAAFESGKQNNKSFTVDMVSHVTERLEGEDSAAFISRVRLSQTTKPVAIEKSA